MVFFLVNNTFHLYDARILAKDLISYNCGLIQVPYSLNPIYSDQFFKKTFVFERLAYTHEYFNDWPKKLIPNLLKNRCKIKNIKNSLKPEKEDILFIFTETELLNQLLVKKFKKAGCRIYLIEDGTAAYIFYNLLSDKLSKRALLLKNIIRCIYGIKGYNPYVKSGYFYPMMSDRYFSGACFFMPIIINRKIPVINLNKNIISEFNQNSSALFLTEPLYNFYIDLETYFISIDSILSIITSKFSIVYLKSHPDEINSGVDLQIGKIAEKYPNVKVIFTKDIIENIVTALKVSYAISFFSTALKNLIFYSIEPIYLFHLIDYLEELDASKQLKLFLTTLNYNFPKSFDEISPGYRSGLLEKINKGINIHELVDHDLLNSE